MLASAAHIRKKMSTGLNENKVGHLSNVLKDDVLLVDNLDSEEHTNFFNLANSFLSPSLFF